MTAPPLHGVDLLLERERELACIDAAIAAARAGSGRSVVVEGPAGIGKSAVLAAARLSAEDGATRFLRARGAELERDFAFGVVRQLFEPMLYEATPAERDDLLQGPARLAARVLGLPGALEEGEAPAATPDASFTVLHGLYWLCANLAADQLVVLSVDDAHWADTSSLRFLTYLLPRLEELKVALLVATRPEAEAEEAHLLATLTADPHADVVHPAPLSIAAVGRLVHERLGDGARRRSSPPPAIARPAASPFLVRELVEALSVEGMSPDARTAARVEAVGARTARRWIQLRLGRLPAPAARLARAVAVLERAPSCRARPRSPSSTRRRPPRPRTRSWRPASSSPSVRWPSSIRSCVPGVYEELGVAERSLAHRRAAELMDGEPAGEEHAAEHLLATEPAGDRAIARRLVDAARTAARRGAPESAAVLLRRALAEPPPAAERPGLLLELGVAEATAGQAAGEVHLQEALAVAGDDPEVALGATLVLAHALGRAERLEDAVAVIDRTAALLRDHDEQTSERLETLAHDGGDAGGGHGAPAPPAPGGHAPARGRRGRARARCSPRRRCAPSRPTSPRTSAWRSPGAPSRRGRRRCRSPPTCRGSPRRRPRWCGPTPSTRPSPRSTPGWPRAVPPATARSSPRAWRGGRGCCCAAAICRAPPATRAPCSTRVDLPAPRLYRTIATGGPRDHAHRAGRPRRGRGGAAAASRRASRRGRRPAPILLLARGHLRVAQRQLDAGAGRHPGGRGHRAAHRRRSRPPISLWRSAAALVQLALGEREAALALAHEELDLAASRARRARSASPCAPPAS